MREALRISKWCLVAACCLNTLFCFGQAILTPDGRWQENPNDKVWLQLNSHSTSQTHGLQPKHTVVISSVKPIIKQLAQNRWEISFALDK